MNEIERGPLVEYEVTWVSGHVERVQAHQVTRPMWLFRPPQEVRQRERIEFHGEFDGHWQLVLSVLAEEILSIRNLSVCGEGL